MKIRLRSKVKKSLNYICSYTINDREEVNLQSESEIGGGIGAPAGPVVGKEDGGGSASVEVGVVVRRWRWWCVGGDGGGGGG